MFFVKKLMLIFATLAMTCGHYPGNWIPSYGCLDYGCTTQEGCSRWNFQRYPCYLRCTYNRCTGPQISRRISIQETITAKPLSKCYKITNLANGKTLSAGQNFDPDNQLKFAVATNKTGEHSQDLWTMDLAYGATYFLKNRHTSEYLKVNPNNKTYLIGNTPMDPTFQFKPILLDQGWSKIQLQAMCNKGYLFVRRNETLVQVTANLTQNYNESLWSVTGVYC
uniref:Uncharacterized protein n=2 Tax=Culex quinquefasciatus TaxID=7176 RepID=A0A1S4K6K6_CULQU